MGVHADHLWSPGPAAPSRLASLSSFWCGLCSGLAHLPQQCPAPPQAPPPALSKDSLPSFPASSPSFCRGPFLSRALFPAVAPPRWCPSHSPPAPHLTLASTPYLRVFSEEEVWLVCAHSAPHSSVILPWHHAGEIFTKVSWLLGVLASCSFAGFHLSVGYDVLASSSPGFQDPGSGLICLHHHPATVPAPGCVTS